MWPEGAGKRKPNSPLAGKMSTDRFKNAGCEKLAAFFDTFLGCEEKVTNFAVQCYAKYGTFYHSDPSKRSVKE